MLGFLLIPVKILSCLYLKQFSALDTSDTGKQAWSGVRKVKHKKENHKGHTECEKRKADYLKGITYKIKIKS